MPCLIDAGAGINCEALRRVGGVNKRAYLFNVSELTSVGLDANNYINSLLFDTTYLGLYKYISRKQAHSGGYTAVTGGVGGNKFFQHDVILKLFPDDPTEDIVMETLIVSCPGIILQDNNDEFKVYGLTNGMDQSEGLQNTGLEPASDVGYGTTWLGSEPKIPQRILVGGSALSTENYLDSLVV